MVYINNFTQLNIITGVLFTKTFTHFECVEYDYEYHKNISQVPGIQV